VIAAIERRLRVLEQRQNSNGRMVHFIEAIDRADSDRQIAELEAAGKVGPLDGFLCLTGSRSRTLEALAGLGGNP
jgi:hypothetical protein